MSSTAPTDAPRDPQAERRVAGTKEAGCGSASGCGGCSLQSEAGCGTSAAPTAPAGCASAAPPAPEASGSERLARRLSGVSPLVSGGIVLALVLIGLVLGGAFGLALVAVAVLIFLGLTALSWGRLTAPTRLMRVAVLAFVLGLAVIRFVPV